MNTPAKIEIDETRLQHVMAGNIGFGSHDNIEHGCCIMEAEAWIADRPWSDRDDSICPVIGAHLRSFNDNLPDDATRNRLLKPLLGRLIGSRASERVTERRAVLAADCYVRTYVPIILRFHDGPVFRSTADAFENLAPFTTLAEIPNALEGIDVSPVERAARALDASVDVLDTRSAIAAFAALAALAARAARGALAALAALDTQTRIAARATIETATRIAARATLAALAASAALAARAARAASTLDTRSALAALAALDARDATDALDECSAAAAAAVEVMDLSAVDLVERMLAITEERTT
jgi:hypothetical protein